jgi:hypothetical protein
MSFTVFHNPKNVSINSGGPVALTGVVSITCGTQFAEIHASADDDVTESVARCSTGRTSGVITFVDPVHAASAKGLSGTLTFQWTDVKGLADKTVTVTGCSLGGYEATVRRDEASSASVPFIARSSDGAAAPVSIA